MSDYDFRNLNDRDFESLCADAIGELLSECYSEGEDRRRARFERFKPGQDAGVDARFFRDGFDEVVLQCKHWPGASFSRLLRHLRGVELPKVKRLKPKRYLLAVSCQLSRADKSAISDVFSPFVQSDADVFGREDLNDILRIRPKVEQRHYKLWLHTSAILLQILSQPLRERSAFAVKEIHEFSKKFVFTAGYGAAYGMLSKSGVVVVAGEPGSGKTTLAEQLCLRFVSEGHQLIVIDSDIAEADAAFSDDVQQIFYFDDFLGRNYLDAVSGREGTRIGRFIRRIKRDPTKKFVLTSRTTILNQGKQLYDQLPYSNLDAHEYLLSLMNYTDYEKAEILYNHLWYSDLPDAYRNELIAHARYKQIVAHQNFTPRLASLITEYSRYADVPPERVWSVVLHRLSDPFEIWHHAFAHEQDDFGRALVALVTFYGGEIDEPTLFAAYARYISQPQANSLQGRRDVVSNLRQLSGSMLQRSAYSKTDVYFDLYSPAVGDYVVKRYANDPHFATSIANALRSENCIATLFNLNHAGIASSETYESVMREILLDIGTHDLIKSDLRYSLTACDFLLRQKWEIDFAFEVLREVAGSALRDRTLLGNALCLRTLVWFADNDNPSHKMIAEYLAAFDGALLDPDQLDLAMRLRRYLLSGAGEIAAVDLIFKRLILNCLAHRIEDEVFEFGVVGINDPAVDIRIPRIEEHVSWWLSRYPFGFSQQEKSEVILLGRNSSLTGAGQKMPVDQNEVVFVGSFLEREYEIDELFQGLGMRID